MSYNHGPVLARKRLATALRELREQRGYTLDYVAGELLISGSKLSRLEKAQGIPQLRDIRDLVGFYGLKEASAGQSLMRWARDGRRKGWWTDFSDVVRPEDTDFIGYENEATVSLQYCIPVIPGLLQTPSYARALLSNTSPQWGERELNRVVETRAIRQQNLHERDGFRPLELKVILHEACLMSQSAPLPPSVNNSLRCRRLQSPTILTCACSPSVLIHMPEAPQCGSTFHLAKTLIVMLFSWRLVRV